MRCVRANWEAQVGATSASTAVSAAERHTRRGRAVAVALRRHVHAGRLHLKLRTACVESAVPPLMPSADRADARRVSTSLRETPLEQPRPGPARDQALNNLAVVRMWWTVLESEWRSTFTDRENGGDAASMVDPRLRAAVGHFEEFDAVVDDLMASGDQVVISLSLIGRIAGSEVSAREAWVCRLKEGAVTGVAHFPTLQDAIASIAPPAVLPVAVDGD